MKFCAAMLFCSLLLVACGSSQAVQPAEKSPCEKKKDLEVCYSDKDGELGCHHGEDD